MPGKVIMYTKIARPGSLVFFTLFICLKEVIIEIFHLAIDLLSRSLQLLETRNRREHAGNGREVGELAENLG